MEITAVEPTLVDAGTEAASGNWLFVEVETDRGITGVGEAATWAYLEATETVINKLGDYLVGKDPLRRDHHWQYIYRNSHFRGSILMGAISAIDIALWDIAGKLYQTPVHQLMSGSTRQLAKACVHVRAESTDELLEKCEKAKDSGFRVIGHINPFLTVSRETPYEDNYIERLREGVERIRKCREVVGDTIDITVELHRRLTPHEAIVFAQKLEEYFPLYIEDPIKPGKADEMSEIARKISLPLATGERLYSLEEFDALLDGHAVDYLRTDLGLAGGFTNVKKIAALAESHEAEICPHLVGSPVILAASLQLAASIPNFAHQGIDYDLDTQEIVGRDYFEWDVEVEDGYLNIPESPGIGVEIRPEALEDLPRPTPSDLVTRTHRDGSVVDQ